ncbi:MAG: hypothetical protein AUH81_17305 [Candidatus Rokubacteria bacterium 13_1_40CM_4_69_5]|nr:MAG: hypothetical protein AUH81_17305 [Candidatus Rokubacteria bacterium 13_1_40CM_4_69_5]
MAKPRAHASRTAARTRLRRLLVREGSYAAIASAAASGELSDVLPTRIFSHIGDVYGRLELAAGPDFPDIAVLRLMVLVHEERPARTRVLLEEAGFAEAAPAVAAILNGFGEVWRAASDEQLREYTLVHASCLAPLLLFELAHEGKATAPMKRAAHFGGIELTFQRWARRLRTLGR